jgi:hypothetical protein
MHCSEHGHGQRQRPRAGQTALRHPARIQAHLSRHVRRVQTRRTARNKLVRCRVGLAIRRRGGAVDHGDLDAVGGGGAGARLGAAFLAEADVDDAGFHAHQREFRRFLWNGLGRGTGGAAGDAQGRQHAIRGVGDAGGIGDIAHLVQQLGMRPAGTAHVLRLGLLGGRGVVDGAVIALVRRQERPQIRHVGGGNANRGRGKARGRHHVVHLLGEGDLLRFSFGEEFNFIAHGLTFSWVATGGFALAGKAGLRAGDVPDGHPAVSANPNRRLSSFPVAFARPSVRFIRG